MVQTSTLGHDTIIIWRFKTCPPIDILTKHTSCNTLPVINYLRLYNIRFIEPTYAI